jgi:hypothetical protein
MKCRYYSVHGTIFFFIHGNFILSDAKSVNIRDKKKITIFRGKDATKVKLSTGAGLLVLVRDVTRYPLKMVIGTYLLISKNVVQHVYLLIVFI